MIKQKIIILNNDLFIGEGMGRKCYIHPEDKNLCVKIPSPRGKRSAEREKSYFKRLHWYGKSFEHIADYMGSIDTNNGSGDLYELVRDYDGNISKNLEYYFSLNDKKITFKMLGLIEDLRVYLIKEYILFSDLDMDNILVKKYDENNFKLVIIDGIGDNNQIPFLEYIKPLGIKRCEKKWDLFKTKIGKKFPDIAKSIKNFNDKL
jgi:hypothetical protein